jgi:hypothetical protein
MRGCALRAHVSVCAGHACWAWVPAGTARQLDGAKGGGAEKIRQARIPQTIATERVFRVDFSVWRGWGGTQVANSTKNR